MWKRLAWVSVSLLAVVACKGKEEASGPAPAAGDSAAAQAAVALADAAVALAKAQAAASAGAGSGAAAGGAAAKASATVAPAASAPADSGFSASLSNELGRLGFSTGASSLVALGKDRGVLLSGLGRLAGHSSALSAVLNDDKVVSAFMQRQDMQDVCRDPEKMKPMLLYVLSSTATRNLVNEPESLRAFTASKLGARLQACPGFKALAQQPRLLATLTKNSPAASAVVTSPNFRAELDRLKIRQDLSPPKIFSKHSK